MNTIIRCEIKSIPYRRQIPNVTPTTPWVNIRNQDSSGYRAIAAPELTAVNAVIGSEVQCVVLHC